jgi:ferric-dicitrate binding protein FerR (iron transport regulator)
MSGDPEFEADRRRIVAGLAALAGAGAAGPAEAETPAGSVITVSGAAVAMLRAARRDLAPNGQVFIGDRIATSEGARASIRLGTSTNLRMGEKARVTIDRFIVDAGGTITLGEGAVLIEKDPASKESLGIRSSYGLIAVRGTRFFAGPSNGVFGVFVARGRVMVQAGGYEVSIAAGEGADIAKPGDSPSIAKPWGEARIAAALAQVS